MDARHQTIFSILVSVDNGAYLGAMQVRGPFSSQFLQMKICLPILIMSPVVRKPDFACEKTGFCLGENKGADQLRGNCESDQRLWFG